MIDETRKNNAKIAIESLTLPQMTFSRDDGNLYFVYKNTTEYVEIFSPTAKDAISESKVENPHMVLKVMNNDLRIVDESMLKMESQENISESDD